MVRNNQTIYGNTPFFGLTKFSLAFTKSSVQDKLKFGVAEKFGVSCRRDYNGSSCHYGRWPLTDNLESCLVFKLGGNSLLVP